MSLPARLFSYILPPKAWQLIDRDYLEQPAPAPATPDATPDAARRGKKSRKGSGRARADRDGAEQAAPDAMVAQGSERAGYDWWVVIVLVAVAVSLSLQEYYGERTVYQQLFPYDRSDRYWTLKGFAWWSGWRFFGYVVIPVTIIAIMPGQRLRDYYISLRGLFRHLWIYVTLFLLILPVVYAASETEAFYRTYPFYKWANRSAFDLWAWALLYSLQFMSLEFFFRGFMLHGLGRVMGSRAIFVMIVPYCMIHFGKPLPETIGAIFAGIILGTLAMRTRSIWGGVMIHIGVAITMDLLALSHCPPQGSGLPCKGH